MRRVGSHKNRRNGLLEEEFVMRVVWNRFSASLGEVLENGVDMK